MNIINQWLRIPWVPGSTNDSHEFMIHPDDIVIVDSFGLGLVKCIEKKDNYYLVRNGKNKIIRVKGNLEKLILPEPEYLIGETVCEVARPEIVGIVDYVEWHLIKKVYMYRLLIGEKRKKRLYFLRNLC